MPRFRHTWRKHARIKKRHVNNFAACILTKPLTYHKGSLTNFFTYVSCLWLAVGPNGNQSDTGQTFTCPMMNLIISLLGILTDRNLDGSMPIASVALTKLPTG